jgi:hypothetical protein
MRRLLDALPGPVAVRVVILVAAALVALVALGFLFEWAGDFLDTGGTVGPIGLVSLLG